MKQITDDMIKAIIMGGGVELKGFLFSMATGPYDYMKSVKNMGTTLQAVSRSGQENHIRYVRPINKRQVKIEIESILQDINSNTHLPESVYNNGIRLDTEHRCQNIQCNPAGKPRLLFVSAGNMSQAMQIKCKCGWMNTFWKNRIDFDEYGALQMKTGKG